MADICIKRIQLTKYSAHDKWNAFRLSGLGLHSVTVPKNNTEHYVKNEKQIGGRGFFKVAPKFIYHNGRQAMITFK